MTIPLIIDRVRRSTARPMDLLSATNGAQAYYSTSAGRSVVNQWMRVGKSEPHGYQDGDWIRSGTTGDRNAHLRQVDPLRWRRRDC